MEVFQGIERYPTGFGPVAATVGNYDGLHLGHRKIIDAIRARAKQAAARSLVITFEPHPVTVVAPQHAPSLLFTRRQKLDALTESGVDAVLVLEFDATVAALSGRDFFEQWLLPRIEFLTIEIGANFRFGRDRSGNLDLLSELSAEHNFQVHGHDAMKVDGIPVSSSQIRQAIREGEVAQASRLLGHAYALSGTIIHGSGRGTGLKYPTANLKVDNELLPASGVYITESRALGRRFASMTNVGHRPTFGGDTLTVETHLLDESIDLYGEYFELHFLEFLRGEKKFTDAEALGRQLAVDRVEATAWLREHGVLV
jgi:riboflavin kinase/FMN adenylyltransferase